MSVTGASNRVDYTGDGSNPTFSYTYPVYTQSDLTVYITPSGGAAALKTLGADYSQSVVNVPGGTPGGSITFNTPPPAASTVSLIRVIPTTQPNSFTNFDKFDAKSAIEFSFDRVVMMCQQLLGNISRSLMWPINATSASLILPDPTVTANQGLFLTITAAGIAAGTPVTASFTNPLTTKGDLMVSPGGATPIRQAIGSDGQVLESDSAQSTGMGWKQGLRKLATAAGDLLYATASGVFTRLAVGANGSILWVTSNLPAWLAPGSNGQVLLISGGIPTWGAPTGTLTAGSIATQSPFTINTKTTQAHGLGGTPFSIVTYLECLTAEQGYSIADRIFTQLYTTSATGNSYIVEYDATNVNIITTSAPIAVNKTTPAGIVNLTAANWKVVVIPYKLN